ncbi:DMT family transporter [Thalassotalea sp. PLHSN55]|uniref:DMT family transporter n=1 Tax=Thalassotalea sp. PLHSN55 TaxID=3435888 RepID=UPI003F86AA73
MNKAIPFVFIFLWSTGFIAIKYGLQYSSTTDFLLLRTLANVVIFALLVAFVRSSNFRDLNIVHAMVAGLFVHGGYQLGIFLAIDEGMPAGLTGIIVGFQPLLTAFIAVSVLQEQLNKVQWFALLVGLFGLILVVSGGLKTDTVTPSGIVLAIIALLGITIGTVYQKRYCKNQALLPSVFWQYVPCVFLFALMANSRPLTDIIWHPEFIFSLAWLVIALSVVAILLLFYMVDRGDAAKVTSYFYLVPPLTALEAWYLFDESLSVKTIVGMVLCALSVVLMVKCASGDINEHNEESRDYNDVGNAEEANNVSASQASDSKSSGFTENDCPSMNVKSSAQVV